MEPSGFGRHERSRRVSREALGAGLAVVGAVMMFLGWFGVSGRANLAEQTPYLASGTIPGAALVVAAAVVLVGAPRQRDRDRSTTMLAELHSLLVEEVPASPETEEVGAPAPAAPARSAELVALDTGTRFHRADCALAAGKPDAHSVDRAEIDRRHLAPCSICEPGDPPS